ncbi:MAG: polyphosphate kinase 2 [Alphaproteobacteria bacterium]|nr:polyphosphate kinase 2 [Alphaproteobacteria bacterium]MBV8412924.1 polyphosphate kinase 2 [Alphaproteobacteria bacterium]
MSEPKGAANSQPTAKLPRKIYERELAKLHEELVLLQKWVVETGQKVCIVFEGRDGAGKGGTIKAITERVSPRVFHVVALPAPTEREKTQMYFQRYVPHFPAAGEIIIFDRSWYNRAGVERIMGFCTEEEAKRFLEIVHELEHLVVESGIVLLKYWLEVSPEEQSKRLQARISDGRKTWKLSPMDLESYRRWHDYSRARDEMFKASDTAWAPWFVVRSDDKRRARLNVIRHFLDHVPHERIARKKVKLPDREPAGDYQEPSYPYKFVPEHDWDSKA